MVPINWGIVPPPRTVRQVAQLASPKTTRGFRCVLTGESLVGVFTHFIQGRTRPCAGKGCFCQSSGPDPRWYGYASAIILPSGGEYLVEFTANAGGFLLQDLEQGTSLRGRTFWLRRRTNKPSAAVDCTEEQTTYAGVLPASFDPVPVLLNLWGVRVRMEVHSCQQRKPDLDDQAEPAVSFLPNQAETPEPVETPAKASRRKAGSR